MKSSLIPLSHPNYPYSHPIHPCLCATLPQYMPYIAKNLGSQVGPPDYLC